MLIHRRADGQRGAAGSAIRSWAWWAVPRPAQVFILLIDAVTVVATAGLLVTESVTLSVLARWSLLVALSLGYAEAAARIERIRRYLSVGQLRPRANPLSVWSFAAVLVVPPGWAAALVIVQHSHRLLQQRREGTGAPHRIVFTAAAATLAQLCAATMLQHVEHAHGTFARAVGLELGVLAAAVVFALVSLAILLTGIWLATRPPRARAMLPDGDAAGYELMTLALGIATGELLLHKPLLAVVMLAPVACIHRAAMIKSVHEAARTDSKTGLLTAGAWRDTAVRQLAQATRERRPCTLAVLDLDGFKAVNDEHGHLVGDAVLHACGTGLAAELRGYDAVGRFGGEEFAALLPGVDDAAALAIGERLRCAISGIRYAGDLRVTVSVGLATTSGGQVVDLDALLDAADRALYQAKAGGRDRAVAAPAWTLLPVA